MDVIESIFSNTFDLSFKAGGVWTSASPLTLRVVDTLESRLVSRCKPILPSFSTATKLVRMVESGLGVSEPATVKRTISLKLRLPQHRALAIFLRQKPS